MGAALHFDSWVPNFGIQEYMRHSPETDAVFPHDYHFADGYLIAGEAPGHGVTIDETLAARYPYEPRQLRSEEHTSELQSLMRISYAVFCLKKKKTTVQNRIIKLNTDIIDHITNIHQRRANIIAIK